MAGENIKNNPKQTLESYNSSKSNTLIISNIFPTAKSDETKQLDKIIVDSKLKLAPKIIELLLKKAKEFSEKKGTSPIFELQKLIEIQKRTTAQNIDINKHPELSGINENNQKRRKNIVIQERKNQAQEAKNQVQEAKNQAQEAENKGQEAKNLIEIKLISEQQKLIKATEESYQKLSPDLKQHSPEEINTKINALSPNTKARLKKNGLSLSDYAQFSLAREKIASLDTKTLEGETFLTTLKKMEKSLGIVEKTDGGYPLSNEPRKETFEQNPQLMEFAKNDESLKGLEKVNVLDDKLNIKQQQKIFQLF
jgi:hypothetical protein